MELFLLLMVVGGSLTVGHLLWPWRTDEDSHQSISHRSKRERFQKRLHIYIPSAANTLGILAISFISGGIVPFILGITGYFLLATMLFMDFMQS